MPRGLKPVRRKLGTGEVRIYWYHRATGTRIGADPETAEGLLEVAALDRRAKAVNAACEAPGGSYGALWTLYVQSPEWRALKPRTRSDYQTVREWLGDAALIKRLATLTSADVFKLRDKAAGEKGRRFANYVIQVLRLTLAWGMRRGYCHANPAAGAALIRKPGGERDANRAWSAGEVAAFFAAAPAQLLVPFALGLFAGMRQGDALRVTWSAYDGAAVRWIAGKNGEACMAPAGATLKAILDKAKTRRGRTLQIAVNAYGEAWSESGFRASFFKLLRTLAKKGLVRPGCTFHGLRHTIAASARDAGESESRVAASIGDRSTAMAAVYGRDSDRAGAQMAVLEGVQKRFANIDWKMPLDYGRKRGKPPK